MDINIIMKECLEAFEAISGEKHLYVEIDYKRRLVKGHFERKELPAIRFQKIIGLAECGTKEPSY